MEIKYESFTGLRLSFEPNEIVEAVKTLKFQRKFYTTEQGRVVLEYFISLLENELKDGVQ